MQTAQAQTGGADLPGGSRLPEHARLATRGDLEAGVDRLLAASPRLLRCADRDLSRFGLATRARTQALEQWLLGDHGARIQLLVDDTRWLERDAPRLRDLHGRFAHALEIRCATEEQPVGEIGWLLADERHALSLQPAQLGGAELWYDHPEHVRPMAAEFDRRWQASNNSLPAVPLGL